MADDLITPDGASEPIECPSMLVWHATLALLHTLSGLPEDRSISFDGREMPELDANCRQIADGAPPMNCPKTISIVERISENVVTISWRDSLTGCYQEQRWLRRSSRKPGRCSLSGARIVRGSLVYAPAERTLPKPCNAGAMILATVLEKAVITQCANS
ncbi:DUF3331 domain-containing protein [Paraburkholderia sp. DD10]|uniref:DUF3331 domain-containing protein n=1 Tax=Paraburkholderia sp. DD10 TaxID=3409691 RepID=UPI003BA04C23